MAIRFPKVTCLERKLSEFQMNDGSLQTTVLVGTASLRPWQETEGNSEGFSDTNLMKRIFKGDQQQQGAINTPRAEGKRERKGVARA